MIDKNLGYSSSSSPSSVTTFAFLNTDIVSHSLLRLLPTAFSIIASTCTHPTASYTISQDTHSLPLNMNLSENYCTEVVKTLRLQLKLECQVNW